MAQLRLGYADIQKQNAEVLQVTHNTPEEARAYFRQYQLAFPYLCDAERQVFGLYGVHMVEPGLIAGLGIFAACSAAAASDLVLRGEKTGSPVPHFKRHGFRQDSPQAIFIVDREGIIRYVSTTGPIGAIPSPTELLHELAALE